MALIADEPGLPRVWLIGDSISIGYTLEVRALLQGRANVHRIPVNGGATEVGLANIEDWLGDGRRGKHRGTVVAVAPENGSNHHIWAACTWA